MPFLEHPKNPTRRNALVTQYELERRGGIQPRKRIERSSVDGPLLDLRNQHAAELQNAIEAGKVNACCRPGRMPPATLQRPPVIHSWKTVGHMAPTDLKTLTDAPHPGIEEKTTESATISAMCSPFKKKLEPRQEGKMYAEKKATHLKKHKARRRILQMHCERKHVRAAPLKRGLPHLAQCSVWWQMGMG